MLNQVMLNSSFRIILFTLFFSLSFSHAAFSKPPSKSKNNDGTSRISIQAHPESVNALSGETASFSINASVNKGPSLKYQWFFNGTEISYAQSSELVIHNISSSNEGNYYVNVRSGDLSVSSESASLTVAIAETSPTPINSDPIALDDSATTNEDTKTTLYVLTNDSDLDGDSLSVTSANANFGLIQINPDSSLTYTPASNFSGNDTVSYTISDGQGGTANATIDMNVLAVNDAPIAMNDSLTTDEDTPAIINALSNDSDIENNPLHITSANSTNGLTTINSDGSLLYTPSLDFYGNDTIFYTISDSEGATANASIDVTVNSIEDLRITYQPYSTNIYAGDSHTLNVSAIGDGALSYQWFKDGFEIIGATQSYLSITNAAQDDSGMYEVIVSDSRNDVLSNAANINVDTKPVIQLSWSTPTNREDGTDLPLSEISHYEIHILQESTNTEQILTVSANLNTYNIEDFDIDSYCIQISTIDIEGNASTASESIQVTL